jgi:hypothetical protein
MAQANSSRPVMDEADGGLAEGERVPSTNERGTCTRSPRPAPAPRRGGTITAALALLGAIVGMADAVVAVLAWGHSSLSNILSNMPDWIGRLVRASPGRSPGDALPPRPG